MKNMFLFRSVLFITFLVAAALTISCTSGKAQTRADSRNGDFEQEELDVAGFGDTRYNSKSGAGESRNKAGNSPDYNEENADDLAQAGAYNAGSQPLKTESFYETGMASWYGREYHGKVTASGEKFNMEGFTAAHKTLPFGSIIEVKNLDNGRTTRVKINDRGPYRGDRILDLSYMSAKAIGVVSSGNAMVGINILKRGNDYYPEDRASGDDFLRNENRGNVKPVVGSQGRAWEQADNYSVQAGAFYSENNARAFKEKIESLTDRPVNVVLDGDMYKVRVNGFSERYEADKCKNLLRNEDISGFVIDKGAR